MPLLEALVLLDILHVITTNDDGAVHLHFADSPGEDAPANGDVASKGTLLIDVGAENSLLGGFVAQSDGLVVPGTLLSEQFLFLKSTLNL